MRLGVSPSQNRARKSIQRVCFALGRTFVRRVTGFGRLSPHPLSTPLVIRILPAWGAEILLGLGDVGDSKNLPTRNEQEVGRVWQLALALRRSDAALLSTALVASASHGARYACSSSPCCRSFLHRRRAA
jgi:hypothetical protein